MFQQIDRQLASSALLLGALSSGRTRLAGLSPADGQVRSMCEVVSAFAVPVAWNAEVLEVLGRGAGGLAAPGKPIDVSACPALTLPLLGAIAGQSIEVTLTGVPPLPTLGQRALGQMGLQVMPLVGQPAALLVRGPSTLVPVSCDLVSADLSDIAACLLAGLACPGETTLVCSSQSEALACLAQVFGAMINVVSGPGRSTVCVIGEAELVGAEIEFQSAGSLG